MLPRGLYSLVIVLILLGSACTAATQTAPGEQAGLPDPPADQDYEAIPADQLKADPEHYTGKKLVLVGAIRSVQIQLGEQDQQTWLVGVQPYLSGPWQADFLVVIRLPQEDENLPRDQSILVYGTGAGTIDNKDQLGNLIGKSPLLEADRWLVGSNAEYEGQRWMAFGANDPPAPSPKNSPAQLAGEWEITQVAEFVEQSIIPSYAENDEPQTAPEGKVYATIQFRVKRLAAGEDLLFKGYHVTALYAQGDPPQGGVEWISLGDITHKMHCPDCLPEIASLSQGQEGLVLAAFVVPAGVKELTIGFRPGVGTYVLPEPRFLVRLP
jgi:hypothetical protein